MAQTFTADLRIGGCPVRGVTLNWGLFHGSEVRREAPSYGTDIDVPAVIEILDLITSGAVTAQEARDVLHKAAAKIIEKRNREFEEREERMEAAMRVGPRVPKQPAFDSRWVYVVSSMDNPKAVKIGVATQIESRMKALQRGSASPLVLRWSARGGFPLERHLHDQFGQRRIDGEWFDFRRVADPAQAIAGAAEEFLRQFGESSPGHE
ncbi:GIY-YIG nuclease family protein [Streptomyces sp. NPDC048644]|uniref:GIY-YIG nuclease family protein n=1 Tax=Streptomyces sp. NPDC048644 TaxID=3365582 RepID=UPI003712FEF7